MADKLICVAAFAGAFGVRGEIRLKSFMQNPEDVLSFASLQREDAGRVYRIHFIRTLKADVFAVRADGVASREEAEALKGVRLCVERGALPEPDDEDEFYFEDLVGLAVRHVDGRPFGEVRAVFNHGAGDLLEIWKIPSLKGARLLPFTRECAPRVDLAAGVVEIDPPPGLFEDADPDD